MNGKLVSKDAFERMVRESIFSKARVAHGDGGLRSALLSGGSVAALHTAGPNVAVNSNDPMSPSKHFKTSIKAFAKTPIKTAESSAILGAISAATYTIDERLRHTVYQGHDAPINVYVETVASMMALVLQAYINGHTTSSRSDLETAMKAAALAANKDGYTPNGDPTRFIRLLPGQLQEMVTICAVRASELLLQATADNRAAV